MKKTKSNFKMISHKELQKSKIPKCSTCNGIKELEQNQEDIFKEFKINIFDVYPADQYLLRKLADEIIRLRGKK